MVMPYQSAKTPAPRLRVQRVRENAFRRFQDACEGTKKVKRITTHKCYWHIIGPGSPSSAPSGEGTKPIGKSSTAPMIPLPHRSSQIRVAGASTHSTSRDAL